MNWDDFRNKLRKDAHQEKLEVDADAIWNAIESQVANQEKKKKRRGFIFWFFFLGLLMLVAGTSWFFVSTPKHDDNSTTNIQETFNSNNTNESKLNNKSKIVSTEENTLSTASNAATQKSPKANNEILATAKTMSPTNNTTQNKTIDTNTFSSKQTKSTTRNTIPQEQATVLTKTPANNPSNSNQVSQQNQKTNKPIALHQETNELVHKLKPTTADLSEAIKSNVLTDAQKTKEASSNSSESLKLIALRSLGLFPFEVMAPSLSFNDLPKPLLVEEEEEIIKKKDRPRFQFYAEALGGISYASRSLDIKLREALSLLNIREDLESSLETSHYGVSLGLLHRSGLGFSIGIQKTNIAEKYQLNESKLELDSVMGVIVRKVNLNGDTIDINGMIPQTTTTIINKKIYSTYQLIDLPILLHYQQSFGKWQAGVSLGVLANLSLKTEGAIPSLDLQDIDISQQQSQVFKTKLGLSYHFGLSISRRISKHLSFNFAPTARFISHDFTVESYGLSQKYTLFGGNLGLQYRF